MSDIKISYQGHFVLKYFDLLIKINAKYFLSD